MTTGSGATLAAPRELVLVGSSAGTGLWLARHLLLHRPWDRVVAIDPVAWTNGFVQLVDERNQLVVAAYPPTVDEPLQAYATTGDRSLLDGPVAIDRPATVVVLAVPLDAIEPVMTWLAPRLASDASICIVSANQTAGIDLVAGHWPESQVIGLHPLLDPSARSAEGQTFLLIRDTDTETGRWLEQLIADVGAITDAGTAAAHDAIMTYVQTMTHQTLIGFADAVTLSGLDLQNIWEARTPVFEGLFGLAARVLAEHQQSTVAGIQVSMNGVRAADELDVAAHRWRAAIERGATTDVEQAIVRIRERFSGALFESVHATSTIALAAIQEKRAQLASHRRTGELVGIRATDRRKLRVGTIVDVTPVSVTLRETMVGPKGSAALIEGPGRRNATRLGLNGSATNTTFGLGQIEVVAGPELTTALSDWLAFIKRDVRFLVPESVAGRGLLAIVSTRAGVRDAEVVSEVVRTGQRAVNVRMHIRADLDVDHFIEDLRAQVQETYRWPSGVSLPTNATHVSYLGPAGTFSEWAARQARTQSGDDWISLDPHPDFEAVLASIGDGQVGVLPISSSASGLVSRSVVALLSSERSAECGGVVDVAVRFDAYVQEGNDLDELQGADVFSHPQALGQCEKFIRRRGLVPIPCASTTEALQLMRRSSRPAVALAGTGFDMPAGVRVAEREVDDLSGSITRFLILGSGASFGEMTTGSDPTLRSIWVADDVSTVLSMIEPGAPSFDELLTDADGRCLWVTSRRFDGVEPGGARYLGRAPWSPRTPVVRVEVDVPRDRG